MNDILKTYMERFRENRHTLRRYTAFVLALAMITTLFVNWQLHGVGISMTAQYQCGEEEHIHTADCYTKVLTCGYEEGELEMRTSWPPLLPPASPPLRLSLRRCRWSRRSSLCPTSTPRTATPRCRL